MDETFVNDDVRDPGDMPGGPIEQTEGTVKRVVLAGIGAAASAYDTAEDTFDRFVDRGQRAQEEWQGRANDVRRRNAGARWRLQEYFRDAMGSMLDSLNIPSKTDVDTINVKLNIVTRKLDDLQMGGVSDTVPIYPETPPSTPPPDTDLTT